ncbi:fungal-specific transcription factor domain-containing protein [Biscogniauxia marginata]|nr:fungal-specific transcription factor domain-containing protein [Biscogniauxia marginata]
MQRPRRKSQENSAARRHFICDIDACGRSFTRSEHLHRHQKNHTNGDATCTRCRAHFKRQDLLERHLERHKQRDKEAGGEGFGILNTRKRMWKDHDGRIVQKKPANHGSNNDPLEAPFLPQIEQPISPPVSSQNSDLTNINGVQTPFVEENVLPDCLFSNCQREHQRPSYWLPSSDCPNIGINSVHIDNNYDEVLQPDTASSFNMPYTTQVNYDWLFSPGDNFENLGGMAPSISQVPCILEPALNSYSYGIDQTTSVNLVPSILPVVSMDTGQHSDTTTATSATTLYYMNLGASSRLDSSTSERGGCCPSQRVSLSRQQSIESSELVSEVDFERPLATLRPPESLPSIDSFTYTQIQAKIQAAKPLAPDGSNLNVHQPLLSIASLQAYCDLFFTKFNTAYPLIHQATFEPHRSEPLLLLSIILLGATYSQKDAHQLAVCIHDVIRPQIFAHADFSPKPSLWMLQTILLVECFGKSRAGQKQHGMSHLFHGMLINLIRRSDCQSAKPIRPSETDQNSTNDEMHWRKWSETEEKKRLALLCFMWDTQHAVLFCQSLCMSAFELILPLPCDQSLWEASTATEWSSLSRVIAPEPMYLLALKSFFTHDSHREYHTNGLSRIILFHGLMSIFWDMQRRDQTSLGVISTPSGHWQNRLQAAYKAWKISFDSFCDQLSEITDRQVQIGTVAKEARIEFDAWQSAYTVVYHAAHILLHSSFLDIQVYAGARHILGRAVQRGDFLRSEKIVKRWAMADGLHESDISGKFPNPSLAAWHAAMLLHTIPQTLVDPDSALFHVPWCLYLATLTTWAFHHAGRKGPGLSNDEDSELVWDAQAEMSALVSSMVETGTRGLPSIQGSRQASGLVWVMAGALSKVRWGIVHEGVTVLKRLIPWRLIGQFERPD